MLPIIISAIECPEDREIVTEFYIKYNGLMYHEAKKHISIAADVEDIVYEALTRIIDKMDVFRDLKPWQRVVYALTTVKNLSYILLKKQKHFEFVSFDAIDFEIPADEKTNPEATVEKDILTTGMRNIWNSLNLDDKLLLEQKYVLHWKDAEIAEPLQIKPESVRMRLTRAKRNLMRELHDQGFDITEWL